jgi:hypothetical protein
MRMKYAQGIRSLSRELPLTPLRKGFDLGYAENESHAYAENESHTFDKN